MFTMTPSAESRAAETQLTVMGALLVGVLAAVLSLNSGTAPVHALHIGALAAAAVVALAAWTWHIPLTAVVSCTVQYAALVAIAVVVVLLSVVGITRRSGGVM